MDQGTGTVIEGGPVPQAEVLAAGLRASLDGLARAGEVRLPSVGGADLVASLAGAGRVLAAADALMVVVLVEAIGRGEADRSGHRRVDWLVGVCPGLSRSHAADLVRVSESVLDPADAEVHGPVLQAVLDGSVGVRRASMVLRALARVRPVAGEARYAAGVDTLLGAARRRVVSESDLSRVTDRLVAAALDEREHDARDRAARACRGVCEAAMADGSLTRFIITADAEGAALVRSVLTSPLAAPAPGPDGTPDPRSASMRRYDAMMTVLARGVATPQGQPTTAKAQLIVTVAYDTLAGSLAAGFTATGQVLSPATVRRWACDADLVPAVLGSAGELLDLGRAVRLVTAGQRRALAHRDQHCTYPGCTVPAGWCDAHHVVHWSRGGRSDLANYALLCPRHHTHVHTHDLGATVEAAAAPGRAVTWQRGGHPVDEPLPPGAAVLSSTSGVRSSGDAAARWPGRPGGRPPRAPRPRSRPPGPSPGPG